MTEKTKKILVVAGASAVCLVLAVGIGLQFGGRGSDPSSARLDPVQNTKDPVVEIQNTHPSEVTKPVVDIMVPDKTPNPAAGADSTGTEQTIQADPVKPEAPEKPVVPSTAPLPDDHQPEDVPQEKPRPAISRSRPRLLPHQSLILRAVTIRVEPMWTASGISQAAARER